MQGKIDHLRGLKENVIVGELIPAGTGLAHHEAQAPQAGTDSGRGRHRGVGYPGESHRGQGRLSGRSRPG